MLSIWFFTFIGNAPDLAGVPVTSIGTVVAAAILASLLFTGGSLWMHRREWRPLSGFEWLTEQPLPRYHLELQQEAAAASLVDPKQPIELTWDSILSIALRPEQRVLGAIAVRAFLQRGGKLSPWPVDPKSSRFGTFMVRAPVFELPALLPGATELVLVIGRPDALFRHGLEDLLARSDLGLQDLQVLKTTLHIRPDS